MSTTLKDKIKKHGIMISRFECRRDGLKISGTEYRKEAKEGKARPVAIVCAPFAKTEEAVKQYAVELASWGYAAFTFDFCGGSADGKSEGKTTEMSVLTKIKDMEAVMNFAEGLPYCTPENTLLMGCSDSGLAAALFAGKYPERVKKLCLYYPAFSLPLDAKKGKMYDAEFDPQNIPETFMSGDLELGKCFAADILGLEPYKEMLPYAGHVFLLHGTGDPVIHPAYTETAVMTYWKDRENGNKGEEFGQVLYDLIDNGQHGFTPEQDEIALELLQEFILTV
ncbi:MAG: alpha/beta hydrolase [Clostridiales bacterium]|nr:alpha/beta hydrolase [Clostridiales bacterium]